MAIGYGAPGLQAGDFFTLFGALDRLAASGGTEGVGRAVNEAVVLSFLGFGAFQAAATHRLLAAALA